MIQIVLMFETLSRPQEYHKSKYSYLFDFTDNNDKVIIVN